MRMQVARIGKPHGIRGEVTVQVLTDAPEERFVKGAQFHVVNGPADRLTIRSARWNKAILLLGFEEIADRNAAETLRQARLEFDTEEEQEDDQDQWYEHELVDLKVMLEGEQVGVITEMRTGTAQDLLVFKGNDGEEVFLPFVEEFVPEIDLEAGTMTITPPAGLLEVNREEGGKN